MNQREDLIEELNQLLKGTHMGAFVLEDLRDKISDETRKAEFYGYLNLLKQHEAMLTKHILSLQGEPVDSSGIKGTIADMMCMIKNMSVVTDAQIIKEALRSIEMGIKALRDFDDRHLTLSETMRKEIAVMNDDYHSIYHSLHKHLIQDTSAD